MPELKKNPTLGQFQEYVRELEKERGFSDQTIIDKCLLLGEEVGELFKAVRKSEGLVVDANSRFADVGDELADILIYLCAVANRKNIDLEAAFLAKEEKNKKRKWEVKK
jgi:NTP pyrophosphatase (non-canonical NTP hydrolase)